MALTTTTGRLAERPLTMAAVRSMARASSTEVPPNFMTIMGTRPRRRARSPQVALRFQQLGAQQSRPRSTTNRLVLKHRELPVEYRAGAEASDRGGQEGSALSVE